jgi:SAM-dependent methyltransferase
MIQIQRQLHSLWLRFCFETLFIITSDTWKYTSIFEEWKRSLELNLIPDIAINKALELGCAEGHTTVQLSPLVTNLVAADISQVALTRAKQRCRKQECRNIDFWQMDITKDPIIGSFQLIICSELLYYVGSELILNEVVSNLADSLELWGYLITTNDYRVNDTEEQGCRNLSKPFGAKLIGKVLTNTPHLYPIAEIHTTYFCIHLFQKQILINSQLDNSVIKIIDLTKTKITLPEQNFFNLFSSAAMNKIFKKIQRLFK